MSMNEYDQIKLMMIKHQDDLTMFPAFHQMKRLIEKTELEHPEIYGSQLLRKMEEELRVILQDLQAQKAEFYPDKIFDALAEAGTLKTLVSVLEQRLVQAKPFTGAEFREGGARAPTHVYLRLSYKRAIARAVKTAALQVEALNNK